MITRIFKVRVPRELHAEFEEKFLAVSVPHVKGQPGLISVSVGRPTRFQSDEYAMISVWKSAEDITSFAGADWSRAVIPSDLAHFALQYSVYHYENIE